jgi:type I restriction enzyme S subunit
MTGVPNGWATATLSDLLHRIEAGLNIKCEERPPVAGERGLVKISAVTWGRFDEAQSKTMPSDVAADERNRIRTGDLLISRANTIELVGASVIVDRIERQLYLSDKVLRLVVHEPAKRWINYALKTPELRKEIETASSGNQLSMRNISQEKLRGLRMPVAPEAEQVRIADKLDAVLARVDAVNDRFARVAALIKRFRQSVLAAATSGRLTEEWRLKQRDPAPWQRIVLADVARDFGYGSAAKSSKAGDVPVLRMGNLQAGKLDWADLVFTSDPKEIGKYLLRDGDVLFNRTNSPELVGKSAVFKGNRQAIFAGYLIRVRCGECLLPDYLNYNLCAPAGRDYCWRVKSDGVSQSNINASKLRAFEFDLPSLAEQAEIIRRVELLFAYADRLDARLQTAQTSAERLTPAVLAKAFRGELVPQDPNDEPASELLRRLRAVTTPGLVKPGRRRAE